MLESKQEQIIEEIPFVKQRKNEKALAQYIKIKRRCFVLSIILGWIIVGTIYFLSSSSNVRNININGNIYLKTEDVLKLAKIYTSDKFLLTFPNQVQRRVKQSELIEDCKVSLVNDNTVNIDVLEKKPIGYCYDDGFASLVLNDDKRIVLESDLIYLIDKIPLLVDIPDEVLKDVEKNITSLDYRMINEISEIHYYPDLKYQYIEIIMRDGGYVFTSPYGLSILNKYYDMKSYYGKDSGNCFYFEDISGNAYVSSCPWDEQ